MRKPKKNLSALTIRRLRRVAKAILAEPKLYDQRNGSVERPGDGNYCGTAGCILGWANLLFPKPHGNAIRALQKRSEGSGRFASDRLCCGAATLGLQINQASRLWVTCNWPEKFRVLNDKLPRLGMRNARNAVARIEHFIATDGAE